MSAQYSRLDSEPKSAEVSEMANFRDSTRASSDDSFSCDDEGLLKHTSRPEELKARRRRAPWFVHYKWPVAHLFLIFMYTGVFILLSSTGLHPGNGEMHLIFCEYTAQDDLSQLLSTDLITCHKHHSMEP